MEYICRWCLSINIKITTINVNCMWENKREVQSIINSTKLSDIYPSDTENITYIAIKIKALIKAARNKFFIIKLIFIQFLFVSLQIRIDIKKRFILKCLSDIRENNENYRKNFISFYHISLLWRLFYLWKKIKIGNF